MSKKPVVSKKAVPAKAVKAVKKAVPAKAVKAVKKKAEAAAPVAPVAPVARETKKGKALELLREGVSIFRLMEEFGWLRHTTRGFLSILGRTHKLESYKNEKGEHCYRLAA